MAENLTNDSTKLTPTTPEPETLSSLDIEIPERPQRIPGFISSMVGYRETLATIDDHLRDEGQPPLLQDDDPDLITYYLVFGNLTGIPKTRPVEVYNRLAQTKIDRTFRMRR